MYEWREGVFNHMIAVKDWAKEHDHLVFATMLYGSQNYGLATEESDVDTKSIVLPGLRSIARGDKAVSMELTLEDGSLDNTKDIREMFNNYLKSNINFMETLYSPWVWVNSVYHDLFDELVGMRDDIANAHPVKLVHMAGGMAEQKYVAFDRPFAGKKAMLEKYGYDPKQLHHQRRLFWFIQTYLDTCDFGIALASCRKDLHPERYRELMQLKTDPLPFDEAREYRELLRHDINAMVQEAAQRLPEDQDYDTTKARLEDLAYRAMARRLMGESEFQPQFA